MEAPGQIQNGTPWCQGRPRASPCPSEMAFHCFGSLFVLEVCSNMPTAVGVCGFWQLDMSRIRKFGPQMVTCIFQNDSFKSDVGVICEIFSRKTVSDLATSLDSEKSPFLPDIHKWVHTNNKWVYTYTHSLTCTHNMHAKQSAWERRSEKNCLKYYHVNCPNAN